MEKEIRSSLFASIPLHASPPPPLARSNAKKWNEINADNCRQQLAAVPACRPTSLTGLRVARSCFAADRFHRHSLCSQLQSGKLSSRSAEQRNKPSHAFPEWWQIETNMPAWMPVAWFFRTIPRKPCHFFSFLQFSHSTSRTFASKRSKFHESWNFFLFFLIAFLNKYQLLACTREFYK